MKIKCDYCGNTFEDTLDRCPNCGAPNIARWDKDARPKTIEDLKTWYKEKGLLPYNVTRFFIGEKVEEPRAFCIYKDVSGDFIVYKNKADGTRVVRYKGKDEEYAVNLLWERLKEEILHQKLVNRQKVNPTKVYNEVKSSDESSLSKKRRISHSGFSRESLRGLIVAFTLIICICVVVGIVLSPNGNTSGFNGTGYVPYHGGVEQWGETTSYNNGGSSGLSGWVDDDDIDSGSSLNWFGGNNSESGSGSSWYGGSSNSWWDSDSNSSSGWSDSSSWWEDDDDDLSWGSDSSWFSSGSDWDSSSWSSSSWDNDYSWSSSDSWSSSSSSWDSDW